MHEQRYEVEIDNDDVSGVRVEVTLNLRPHADRATVEATIADAVRRVLLSADLPTAPDTAPVR